MTHKEEIQIQMNQMALYTIEKILTSPNVPTEEGKLKLIGYIVRAANQVVPEMEFKV